MNTLNQEGSGYGMGKGQPFITLPFRFPGWLGHNRGPLAFSLGSGLICQSSRGGYERQATVNQNLTFEDIVVGCLGGREHDVGQLCLPREKRSEYVGPVFFIQFFAQGNLLEGLQKGFDDVLAA